MNNENNCNSLPCQIPAPPKKYTHFLLFLCNAVSYSKLLSALNKLIKKVPSVQYVWSGGIDRSILSPGSDQWNQSLDDTRSWATQLCWDVQLLSGGIFRADCVREVPHWELPASSLPSEVLRHLSGRSDYFRGATGTSFKIEFSFFSLFRKSHDG